MCQKSPGMLLIRWLNLPCLRGKIQISWFGFPGNTFNEPFGTVKSPGPRIRWRTMGLKLFSRKTFTQCWRDNIIHCLFRFYTYFWWPSPFWATRIATFIISTHTHIKSRLCQIWQVEDLAAHRKYHDLSFWIVCSTLCYWQWNANSGSGSNSNKNRTIHLQCTMHRSYMNEIETRNMFDQQANEYEIKKKLNKRK